MHRTVLTGTAADFFRSRRAVSVNVFGRIKPGLTREQAEASLKPLAQQLAQAYPADNAGRSVRLLPIAQAVLNPNARGEYVRAGTLLLSLAGVVLLIACANLANLLLARATARQREIAMRIALGARRRRVIRDLLGESLLLAALGGGAGIVAAFWIKDLLWSFRPPGYPENFAVSLDLRVLGFALGISLLTGVLFGLAPAWMSTKVDLIGVLKREGGTSSRGAPLFAFRNLLVSAQVALSVIALVIAGLFLRGLHRANAVEPGWNARNLGVIFVNLAAQGYDPQRTHEYHARALDRLRSIPGVINASVANRQFFAGRGVQRTLRPQGTDEALRTRGQLMMSASVHPSYLKFMGIPLLSGRDFTPQDDASRPPVVIINETLARRGWPGEDALGKTLKVFGSETLVEVVGVVRDTLYHDLAGAPEPFAFFPFRQQFHATTALHFRTATDPTTLFPTVRKELQSLDPSVSEIGVRTMDENLRMNLWGPRTGAMLMSIFGALALLLAMLGVYAIMAHSVGQRTREIGIRMAIGAQTRDVLALIVRRGVHVTVLGLTIGLALAYAVARHFQNFFFQVSPLDPPTYGIITLLLVAAAVLACWIPARRAARVNPISALRAE